MKRGLGIIPARFESTRFPGKPLAQICGKPMIQRVFEAARNAELLDQVLVATDDERVAAACRAFGAEAVMTSTEHRTGTERAAEAAAGFDYPIIVNIQGDEPLLNSADIDKLVRVLQDEKSDMASLMVRISNRDAVHDRDKVKVVTDKKGYALYFSRSMIPSRSEDGFFQHIGIYGFQRDFLEVFTRLEPSRLEICENLEQLRALENGYRIRMIETSSQTWSVDTPQDVAGVERILREREG